MCSLIIAGGFRFFQNCVKRFEPTDLLETSRGPEAFQREGALEVSVFLILSGACYSVRRKKAK